jgi:NitT/TauT family transport system substrate-binding protein
MYKRLLALSAVVVLAATACSPGASPSAPASASAVAVTTPAPSVAATPSAAPTPAPSPISTTLQLDFSLDATLAPLLYGIDQGYFTQNGIDLKVLPSTGSNVALPLLDSKKVDFALINMSSIMSDVIQNKSQLVGVTTWENYASFGIVALFPINDLKELEGKNFGTVAFSSGRQNFPLVLQANGVDPTKVPIKLLDFSVLYQALFQKTIDTAETGVPGSGDVLKVQADKLGKTIYEYPFSKWGFVDYNKVLVTRADVIQSNPALVQQMVTAVNMSMSQALANMTDDKAVALLTAQNPQSDPAASKFTWQDFKSLTKNSGPFDPATVATIFDRTITQQKLTTTLKATDFYTNQFQAH